MSKALFQNGSYINGQWLTQGNTFAVDNPATHITIAEIQNAGEHQVLEAVDAAYKALPAWQAKTANERSSILRKWFKLIMHQQDELATLLTQEQGKTIAEAKGEIAYGANYIEWYAEEAKRIYGDTIPSLANDSRIVIVKQPVGVVAAITPWNFPNAMIARKVAPALAAGCTFVVKPASETPLSALALAELGEQAGIPKGVFNVVVGTDAAAIGKVLTQDSRVAKFSFTGSTAIGKLLLSQCASTVKKVSMELGGNAPFIIFEDADIDAAVTGTIVSKFRNAGQTCVCTNRILVHESIAKEYTQKLIAAVQNLKVGKGNEEGIDIGPIITNKAAKNIKCLLAKSIDSGAKIEFGEIQSDLGENFLNPVVISNVTQDMDIAQNEIFGPIAPIIKFKTEEEAIKIANDTTVGLAAYFYSRDIGRVWRVSEALEYGMVGINSGSVSNPAAPFGGIKQSGMGREGSKYGIDDYLEIKYLMMSGLEK